LGGEELATTVSSQVTESIQSRLRRYYLQEQQLYVLRSELEALTESLAKLRDKLLTLQVSFLHIFEPQRAIDPQCPVHTNRGYAQSAMDRGVEVHGAAVEVLQKAVADRKERLARLQLRISTIEEERAPIRRALELLDERSRLLIERRYAARWSLSSIGSELHLCPSAVHKLHNDILERLAELLSHTEAPVADEEPEIVRCAGRLEAPEAQVS
jgi:chromosome segregation ATPase